MNLWKEEVTPRLKLNSEGELNKDSVIAISAYVLAKTLVGDFDASFSQNMSTAQELIANAKN